MRALLLSFVVLGIGVGGVAADDDPPPPDPGSAVAPDAPPLVPLPPPTSRPPAPAPAPPWGATLPLVQLDPYPEALVDRPLVMFGGMTELDADYDLASTTAKRFGHRTEDIGVRHSFGTFQLEANLGDLATLEAMIPVAPSFAVLVAADSGAPQADDSLHVGQFAALEYKARLSPGQCAAFFAVGASYNENRVVDPFGMLVWTQLLFANGDAELEVQLLPTLALDVGLSFDLPVEASAGLVTRSTISAACTLLLNVAHSWDVYANGAVFDLGTNRLPYLAFGFAKRWGE